MYQTNGKQYNSNSFPQSRPISIYDNFTSDGATVYNSNSMTKPKSIESSIYHMDMDKNPSQAHCLVTTVPQNIASQNIANKHTPTRTSLKHSRMVALNKRGRVPRKYLPAIIKHHKLAKGIMTFITILGITLCLLAVTLNLWTPSLEMRYVPYWSGIPVLISGILGLILLCCCRKQYPGMKRRYLVYAIKVSGITLSCVSTLTTYTSFVLTMMHLIALKRMTCSSPGQFEAGCECHLHTNDTTTIIDSVIRRSYHYVDLNCAEVDEMLSVLFMLSCINCLTVGILETWYLYLHWLSRNAYTYFKVTSGPNQTTTSLVNMDNSKC